MVYDVLICGGGPSGLTAAIYACRAGLKTIIFEKLMAGGQMNTTFEIENYPGFQNISGFELGDKMLSQAKLLGVEHVNSEVSELLLNEPIKIAKTADREFMAKTVILSMGANRRKLGLLSEDRFIGRGVSYCATCDGGFYKGKDVAVVGGGNTALEDALYLSNIVQTVYLIHRRLEFRGNQILVDAVMKTPNIKFVLNSVVDEILGDTSVNKVSVKELKGGTLSELSVSGVFLCLGSIANTSLVNTQVALSENGNILADETCKTNIPGVFAAGDIREKPLYQIVSATSDGANAANSASAYIKENHI